MKALEVLWVRKTCYKAQSGVSLHSHTDYYQLGYCIQGTACYVICGKEHEFSPGSLLIVKPDELHYLKNTHREDVLYLEVKFTVFEDTMREQLQEAQTLNKNCSGVIKTLLGAIWEEANKKSALYDSVIEAYMTLMISEIIRDQGRLTLVQGRDPAELQGDSTILLSAPDSSAVCRSVKKYLDKNVNRTLTMGEMAESLCYSESYLCQVFKKETGHTIREYHNILKVQAAKDMLLNPSLQLKEVSQILGFKNQSNFSRVFRRVTRMSPIQWKNEEIRGHNKSYTFGDNAQKIDVV